MFLKGDVSELVRGSGYLGFVSPFLTKVDESECERGSCFLGFVLTYRTAASAAACKLKGGENMKQAAAGFGLEDLMSLDPRLLRTLTCWCFLDHESRTI